MQVPGQVLVQPCVLCNTKTSLTQPAARLVFLGDLVEDDSDELACFAEQMLLPTAAYVQKYLQHCCSDN